VDINHFLLSRVGYMVSSLQIWY